MIQRPRIFYMLLSNAHTAEVFSVSVVVTPIPSRLIDPPTMTTEVHLYRFLHGPPEHVHDLFDQLNVVDHLTLVQVHPVEMPLVFHVGSWRAVGVLDMETPSLAAVSPRAKAPKE